MPILKSNGQSMDSFNQSLWDRSLLDSTTNNTRQHCHKGSAHRGQ
jgi:hypothetical protein